MIKINKNKTPEHFDLVARDLLSWDAYDKNPNKQKLKKDLAVEQHYLCCYCERGIYREESGDGGCHIEHIYPKSLYEEKQLDYNNLIVSCDGYDNDSSIKTQETCGHKKDNNFEEKLFLDPTKVVNIEEYFIYDKNTGEIFANNLLSLEDKLKANYMIQLLNLNSNPAKNGLFLPLARRKAIDAILIAFRSGKIKINEIKQLIQDRKQNTYLPFISFIHYYFNK